MEMEREGVVVMVGDGSGSSLKVKDWKLAVVFEVLIALIALIPDPCRPCCCWISVANVG